MTKPPDNKEASSARTVVSSLPPRYLSPVKWFAFRGPEKTLESSNHVLFNPTSSPGCGVIAGSCAAHESIGSQVACGLALKHFTESLLKSFEGQDLISYDSTFALKALESAFREANRNVYSFGHSLAAGGRMAAVFIALIYLQDSDGSGCFCAGRVGDGNAFLYRNGEIFPFFESVKRDPQSDVSSQNFLGANSLISVELANVPLEDGDELYLFSEPLEAIKETELRGLAEELSPEVSLNPAEEITRFLFDTPSAMGFSFSLHVGRRRLFLPPSSRV